MIFNYLSNNFNIILEKLLEHIEITIIAVIIAIIIGVPLGILVSKSEKMGKVILGVANIFQTIPSLALFGFIIPLPLIGGIGYRPAVIVLLLYALLPIIKNTYIGIQSVDDSIVESARGMGMTSRQILFMVTLPLAFPIIMGGIRVATVINIGTATIASLIGAGGLGDFIFRGISMSDTGMILAGAIPTTLLALFVDFILGLFETKIPINSIGHLITSKKALKRVATFACILVVLIGGLFYTKTLKKDNTIIIGTKNFTESRLLGEILSEHIKKSTDLDTKIIELGGSFPAFKALENNEIDMYVEYTGTAYTSILKRKDKLTDPNKVYNILKEEYEKTYNISWLKPLGFNNTFALAVRNDIATKYGLNSYSDLAKASSNLVFGATAELIQRPDGYDGLKKLYGFEFKDIKTLETGLRYNAIQEDKIQVTNAFSTDGKIEELKLKILEDNKNYFPPYYAVPIVNNKAIEKYPSIQNVLEKLEDKISDETMQKLNFRADVKKEELNDIAKDFIKELDIK